MHGAAQWGTFGQMAQGNTVVLMPRFDAEEVWRIVEELGVNSVLIAGDAMGRPMIEALEAAGPDRWDLSSLFAVTSSAALFSVPVKERFFAAFPNLLIIDSIGSSEGGFNGLSAVGKDNPTGGSTGGLPRVAPMADVIVVDDDLNPLTPGDGQVGKVARAGNIPLGYYKDPEKTAKTFLTGARREALRRRRRLRPLGGRRRRSPSSAGGRCASTPAARRSSPRRSRASSRPTRTVFDVLVVGVPDERWGNAVTAVVAADAGLDTDARRARRPRPLEAGGLQAPAAPRARRRDRPLPRRQARLPVGHPRSPPNRGQLCPIAGDLPPVRVARRYLPWKFGLPLLLEGGGAFLGVLGGEDGPAVGRARWRGRRPRTSRRPRAATAGSPGPTAARWRRRPRRARWPCRAAVPSGTTWPISPISLASARRNVPSGEQQLGGEGERDLAAEAHRRAAEREQPAGHLGDAERGATRRPRGSRWPGGSRCHRRGRSPRRRRRAAWTAGSGGAAPSSAGRRRRRTAWSTRSPRTRRRRP